MPFDGTEGGKIDLRQAKALTKKHRDQGNSKVKGHFFGRDILQEILKQPGCMGIRMYYGIDDQGVPQLVLVGADKDERDMTEGTLADISKLCPPACGVNSELNAD